MKKLMLGFLLSLLSVCVSDAQNTDTSFNKILNNVKQYNVTYPQEKVHLHFDKPFYALGDTVWFEGYVVNALNNTPSDHSGLLYVDLINAKDSICKRLELPVNVGFAAGDITLDSLQAGNYRIRAYTNWMRNFSADYFFNKEISIADPFPKTMRTAGPKKSAVLTTQARQSQYDMQFFPEGGQLVDGLKSSVAFKAISSSGMGMVITGKLTDQQQNEVLSFKTEYAGMGSFTFTPAKDKIYTALIKLPDGTTKNISLPKALESGYVLTADYSSSDSLTITMLASPDLVDKEEMVLMPLSNGNPLFFFKTRFPNKRINVTVPKDKLPGGIIQWTLFNSKNAPIAERLIFNDYVQKIKLTAPGIKQVYQKRGKAELTLQATDDDGDPLIGSFSVAVTNADNVQSDEQTETTIFSNLLLTSDLKGYVETPNYYFTAPSPEKNRQLDNLLLTQGWRRFVWDEAAKGGSPKISFSAEQGPVIRGSVINAKNAPVAGIHLSLIPKKLGDGGIRDTVTDQNGRFKFSPADDQIGSRFILQAKQKRGQGLTVKLDEYDPPAIEKQVPLKDQSESPAPMIIYAKAAAKEFTVQGKSSMFNKVTQLKQVEIRDYNPRKKLVNSHSTNLNGPGNADRVITGKEIENWPDISLLRGMWAGYSRVKLIIVDGVQMDLKDVLQDVKPMDIESIELLTSAAYAGIYGIRAGSGAVLIITTKQGPYVDDPSDTARVKNVLPFKLPIYMAREFYSPKYDNPANANKGLDLRTTVYWNPDVVTDKDGKATVQYYNTDAPGNYRIVIEGISAKGNLCRQVYRYKVE